MGANQDPTQVEHVCNTVLVNLYLHFSECAEEGVSVCMCCIYVCVCVLFCSICWSFLEASVEPQREWWNYFWSLSWCNCYHQFVLSLDSTDNSIHVHSLCLTPCHTHTHIQSITHTPLDARIHIHIHIFVFSLSGLLYLIGLSVCRSLCVCVCVFG